MLRPGQPTAMISGYVLKITVRRTLFKKGQPIGHLVHFSIQKRNCHSGEAFGGSCHAVPFTSELLSPLCLPRQQTWRDQAYNELCIA